MRRRAGRYVLQDTTFELYYDPGALGGEGIFEFAPGGYVTVVIGKHDNEVQMLASLLHELLEISFRLSKGAYAPAYTTLTRYDAGRYRFMMDHDQFTEAVQHVGDALYYAWPALLKAAGKAGKKRT